MITNGNTLGSTQNEQIDAKKTSHYRRVLVVTQLFNIAVNDFDAKKSTSCRRVLVVTELASGTQCSDTKKSLLSTVPFGSENILVYIQHTTKN